MDRVRRHLRRAVLLVSLLSLITLSAAPAQAALIPFVILIENGLDLKLRGTDAKGLSLFTAQGVFHLVVNGKIDISLGSAEVVVWGRTVPDPFFKPFGPFAALVVLDFGGGLTGHLSLIQAPTELRTTIGVLQSKVVNTGFSGNWVFSNGTTVVGGDANDLVIGGVLVAGVPTPIPDLALDVNLYFPTVPFPSDPTPTSIACLPGSCAASLGSFYGSTVVNGQARPVRAYNVRMAGLLPRNFAHLLVIETGANSYTIVACAESATTPPTNPSQCTVSIPGSAVSGVAHYDVKPLTTDLDLNLFGIVP